MGTRDLAPLVSPGDSSKLGTQGWPGVSALLMTPPLPLCPVAQKVVTLRKQQQLLAACKSLPSSPSHSAASTPVAGQVSRDFRVHGGTCTHKEVEGVRGADGKRKEIPCRKCIDMAMNQV